jgi:hypothetical protein
MERRSFLMQAAILPFVRIARGATSERGKTQRVNSEVKEFKDPDTGARVLQLTSDGSDNVHLYFTSESFFGGGSDRVVFGSNRSGQFQFYMLEIRERKLVQLTEGSTSRSRRACRRPATCIISTVRSCAHSNWIHWTIASCTASRMAGRPILPHARPMGSMWRSRIARSSR